jgi:hypothetical protein
MVAQAVLRYAEIDGRAFHLEFLYDSITAHLARQSSPSLLALPP